MCMHIVLLAFVHKHLLLPAFGKVFHIMLKQGLAVVCLILLHIVVVFGKIFPKFDPRSDEMIDYINLKANTTWKV